MSPTDSDPTSAKSILRIDDAPERVLLALACGTPLLVQAGNRMASLATLSPLGEMAGCTTGRAVFFPEIGLDLAIEEVEAVHALDFTIGGNRALSVEFAIGNHPRALAIAALAAHGDDARVRDRLRPLRAARMAERAYQKWQDGYTRPPPMCPCCRGKAETRRQHADQHPVFTILADATEHERPLRCTLLSAVCGFSSWILPGILTCDEGRIECRDHAQSSMIELDPGLFHAVHIRRCRMDGEPYTALRLFDSLGIARVEISTPGWQADGVWHHTCELAFR